MQFVTADNWRAHLKLRKWLIAIPEIWFFGIFNFCVFFPGVFHDLWMKSRCLIDIMLKYFGVCVVTLFFRKIWWYLHNQRFLHEFYAKLNTLCILLADKFNMENWISASWCPNEEPVFPIWNLTASKIEQVYNLDSCRLVMMI